MHIFNTRARTIPVAVFLLSAFLMACGPQAPSPLPTRTPMPTFTPVPPVEQAPIAVDEVPVAEPEAPAGEDAPVPQVPVVEVEDETSDAETPAEPEPVETEPEAPAPAPVAEIVVNSAMNVRGGPGTNYNVIGAANAGQSFPVTGRNADNSWWQINYNGQAGWVFADLVSEQNTQAVTIAANIPAPPPPTATPIPQPTPVPPAPEPQPEPEQPAPEQPAPAPAPADNFPFSMGEGRCDPNAGMTYFQGFVRDSNNELINGVCVHVHFYEPRNTKCSGCDGVGQGVWGFSPFGGPAPSGTPIEIFVVECDGEMLEGGQTQATGFGNLTPQSPKWTRVIADSEQCTGITFYRR
ncbi:MAG: SH3 domain-containing protein [Litorilinea sp.]